VIFWVACWNLMISCPAPSLPGYESPLCSLYLLCLCYPPISHLVVTSVIRLSVEVLQCLCASNHYAVA
jgi:hypothetical protein